MTRRRYPVESLPWSVAGFVPVLSESMMRDGESGLLAAGLLSLLLGARIYWVHGGARITALGLWSLASAVFIGFAAIWWWSQPGILGSSIYLSTMVGYWTNLFIWLLCGEETSVGPRLVIDERPARWAIWWGVVVALLGITLWEAGFRFGAGVQAVSFVGFALLVLGLIGLQQSRKFGTARGLTWTGAMVGIFTLTTFTGYGRLILVSLALVPVLLLASQAQSRHLKVLVMTGVPISLSFFGWMRERFAEQQLGVTAPDGGIGSILSPLRDFSSLVLSRERGLFELGRGETFFATIAFPVPRSLWQEKPIGFGANLTEIIHPDLIAQGHSAAALAHGEWYYNFGWFGIVLMLPLLAGYLRWLDSLLVRRTVGREIHTPRDLIGLMIVLILVADLPNLLWVGTFGYVSRTVSRLVVAGSLLPLAARRRSEHVRAGAGRWGQRRRGPHDRQVTARPRDS